jgi:hypothetical protein
MRHPDFRVGGRIFATIGWPDQAWAMVKLTPEQQAVFIRAAPKVFCPVSGKWGLKGSTNVRLSQADAATLKPALMTAWQNVALKPSKKDGDPSGEHKRRPVAGDGMAAVRSKSPKRLRR